MQISGAASAQANQVSKVQNKHVNKTETQQEAKKVAAPATDSVSISDAAKSMMAAKAASSQS